MLNLRGRIVTAIHLCNRLGLESRAGRAPRAMAIGIELAANRSVFWSNAVGEVLKLPDGDREPNPINLDRKLARVSAGVFRLDGQLLVVLDVDRVLDLGCRGGGGMNVDETSWTATKWDERLRPRSVE